MPKLSDTKKRKKLRLFRKNKKKAGKIMRTSSKSVEDASDMASNINDETSKSRTTIERR